MTNPYILIIDFDSTFIKKESLDYLISISLEDSPKKEHIYQKIKQITKMGMEGLLSFDKSLEKRLQETTINKNHIQKLIKLLKLNISDSILRNKKWFLNNSDKVYIVSGGFKEIILPIVTKFGISSNNVLANTFLYKDENVLGFDKSLDLAKEKGKVMAVKKLNLAGKVYAIGDGYTDYQISKYGAAYKFIYFAENLEREVSKKADFVAKSFEDVLSIIL